MGEQGWCRLEPSGERMAMPDAEPTHRDPLAVGIPPGQSIRDQHIIADASDLQRHLDDYRLGYNTIRPPKQSSRTGHFINEHESLSIRSISNSLSTNAQTAVHTWPYA